MANQRVFYACQAVIINAFGTNTADGVVGKRIPGNAAYPYVNVMHGVQSVGITSNFNLEQVFELGQLYIYDIIDGIPEVEVTIEKVIDGHISLWHAATNGVLLTQGDIETRHSLLARSAERCDLFLAVYDETKTQAIHQSVYQPTSVVECTGMYVSNISYTFPTDGFATESITLVGNHKVTNSQHQILTTPQLHALARTQWPSTNDRVVDFTDHPATGLADDPLDRSVVTREYVDIYESYWPNSVDKANNNAFTGLPGMEGTVYPGGGTHKYPAITNVSISCDLGREDVFVLGQKMPTLRTPNYPVEVTCDIEILAKGVDNINVGEEVVPYTAWPATPTKSYNRGYEKIVVKLTNGAEYDLGGSNFLNSVSYGGGDATGGNATITYSYTTYNVLRIPFTP